MRCSRGIYFSRGGQSMGENGTLGRSVENSRRAVPYARGPEGRREIVTYEVPISRSARGTRRGKREGKAK